MKGKSVISLKATILFLIVATLSSCASYKNSNKTKGEDIQMNIVNGDGFDLESLEPQAEPGGPRSRGIMIGDVVSLAIDGIKLLIDMDKEKYTAQYTSGTSEIYFYNQISDKGTFDITGMQFDGFNLVRTVEDKHGIIDTAFFISFKVDKENPYEIFNNSYFRLVVDDFRMDYSKAKVPGSKWYMPWTLMYYKRNQVNLDMEISFTSSWTGVNSSINRDVEIGKFIFNMRNIPLTDDRVVKEEFRQAVIGSTAFGYCFLVPRSHGFYWSEDKELKPGFGQGKYDILVNVTESGKNHFVTKIVQDNSDVILDQFKGAVMDNISF